MWCVWFLAKVIAIYFIKEMSFDSKNNYKGDKPVYLRLANS